MAKLPDIEYGGAVPSAEDAPLREGDALQRATGVIAEGLTRYGMEVVKTRTARATAELSAGLAELETAIGSRQYVTTQEVRNVLGADFDSLPSHVKSKLTTPTLDAATGQMVDGDRKDIPVWEIWGPLFDARAKRILDASGKDIPGSWRSAFETQAVDEIVARKLRMNDHQVRAMNADLRAQQGKAVDDLARNGSFDQALAVIDASAVFTPAEKVKASAAVEHARQVRPFDDIVLAGLKTTADVLEAGKLVGRLESGEGLDQVPEKERIERKRELERLVAGYDREAKWKTEHAFDEADAAAQDTMVDALVKARGRPLSFALVPARGQASPKMREHLYRIIEGTQKAEGGAHTDPLVYDLLNRMARDNPRAFVDHDILQYVADGKLEMSHFTRFSDLQRSLKTEGAAGIHYQSFVGPQEETDRLLLERGVQVRGERISEKDQKVRGYVHRAVDDELWRATVANGGKALELDRRNAIIQSTVAREYQKKGWFSRGSSAPASEVDAQLPDAGLRRVAVRLGRKQEGKEYDALVAGYEAAVPAMSQAWKLGSTKPLRQDDAFAIYELAERRRAEIDAGVARAKQERGDASPVTDAERLAAAVQLYRGGMR